MIRFIVIITWWIVVDRPISRRTHGVFGYLKGDRPREQQEATHPKSELQECHGPIPKLWWWENHVGVYSDDTIFPSFTNWKKGTGYTLIMDKLHHHFGRNDELLKQRFFW